MKKPLIYSICAFTIGISSCKKSTKCYTCTVKAYGVNSTNVTSTSTVCDKTSQEIKDYENAGSITTKTGNTTTSVITTCTQQ